MCRENKTRVEAQPVDVLGQVASGLAHEFNNLFTAIGGSAEMALLDIGPRHRVCRDLETIRSASARGAEMVNQLLYAAGKKGIHREKIGCLGWQRVLRSVTRAIHPSISSSIDIPHTVWPIYVDREQLNAALQQMVNNAVGVMPGGGRLALLLDNVHYTGSPTHRSGPYLRLRVEDTGEGMEEQVCQRIFEPFFTTQLGPEHSGLGLAMVQGIVDRHGGWIDVNSLPGEGTRLSIYWPAQPDYALQQLHVNSVEGLEQARRVLVVEDEEDVREFTMMGLSQDGFDVAGAGSAEEAETLFGDEVFHLVLSDVGLPDGNGVDLIERLVLKKPELKVVLSSGYSDHHHRWPTIMERGYPFLEKPYALQDLIDTVRQMNA